MHDNDQAIFFTGRAASLAMWPDVCEPTRIRGALAQPRLLSHTRFEQLNNERMIPPPRR